MEKCGDSEKWVGNGKERWGGKLLKYSLEPAFAYVFLSWFLAPQREGGRKMGEDGGGFLGRD